MKSQVPFFYQAVPDSDESRVVEITEADLQSADIIEVTGSTLHLLRNQKSVRAEILQADYTNKEFVLRINGEDVHIRLRDEVETRVHAMGFDVNRNHIKLRQVVSPMPGLVLKVLVKEGDEVKEGDPVVVLEAMKMENVLNAPTDGTIGKVHAEAQKNVDKGQILIEFD